MPKSFLVSGDLHLGRRTVHSLNEGGESLLSVSDTWQAMVDLAVDREVEAVLLTGDLIDKENRFFEARHALITGIDKLQEHRIRVYAVAGNHDAGVLPEIADSLDQQKNFRLIGRGRKWESVTHQCRDGKNVEIAGWSFDREQVYENPLAALNFKPASSLAVAMLHCDLDASPDSPYAPVSMADLTHSRWPVWLLGHIHKPEVITEHNPLVMYPGSPHALHANEKGNHGPYLLQLHPDGSASAEQLPLSPIRYESVEINLDQFPDEADWKSGFLNRIHQAVKTEQYDRLAYRSLDVICTGDPQPFKQIEKYFSNESERQLGGRPAMQIRKLVDRTGLPKADLMALAGKPNLIGILAGLINELESNKLTPRSEELLKHVEGIKNKVYRHPTFQPLLDEEPEEDSAAPEGQEEDIEGLVLQAARDWLTELRKQEMEAQNEQGKY